MKKFINVFYVTEKPPVFMNLLFLMKFCVGGDMSDYFFGAVTC